MFDNSKLMKALLSCALKNAISLDIISNDLEVDRKTAEAMLNGLIEKELIFNYNYSKKVNLLISYQKFEKTYSSLESILKKEIEKDFCFFNEKLDIFSGKIKHEEPLSDKLKEQALDLIKNQKTISSAILQKILQIGYPNACKIIDWLLEQKLIRKTNTYEVIKNEK